MDTYDGENVDPFSLHKYLYCEANPINCVDPSGHDDIGDMLAAIDIGGMLGSAFSSTWQSLNPYSERHTGFAYDLWAEKKGGVSATGWQTIEKGKTIVEDAAGIAKFKADVADVRQKGYQFDCVQFYGHGGGGGILGYDDKAEIWFDTTLKSPVANQVWAPDFENLFTGLMRSNVRVELQFCASLDDQGTINLFRRLAPQADIWGGHGLRNGVGDYGPLWGLEHY